MLKTCNYHLLQNVSSGNKVHWCFPSWFGCPRFGSRTDVPSGESERGINRQNCVKMALVHSSMDSCSLMMTCTQATPTTTGLPRAWRATRCRQRASHFLTPWMWAPSPPSPCFPHRVPSPQWTWPRVWCPLQWLGFPPQGSTTWVPLTTSTVQRHSTQWRWLQPRAPMPPRPVPTCTETPAIPAWPAFGLRQSSMPTLRIRQCRTPCLTWVPANTLWIGLCEGEKLDGNTAQFTRKSIFTSVLFSFLCYKCVANCHLLKWLADGTRTIMMRWGLNRITSMDHNSSNVFFPARDSLTKVTSVLKRLMFESIWPLWTV